MTNPYRGRDAIRKRETKNYQKKYLVETLSRGMKPGTRNYALSQEKVAMIAGCSINEVVKHRTPREFVDHIMPMYRNPVIISNVRKAMHDLGNSNVTLRGVQSRLTCYDVNKPPPSRPSARS